MNTKKGEGINAYIGKMNNFLTIISRQYMRCSFAT